MGENNFCAIIVMGVSGCGKSTLGLSLADELGWEYVEGDDLHPANNIDAMSRGIPLTDEMRLPWLAAISDRIVHYRQLNLSLVVSCSALKRHYRDTLIANNEDVVFVHLDLDRNTLITRMAERQGHFMPSKLLDSQLNTLEPLASDEKAIVYRFPPSAEQVIERLGSIQSTVL